MFENKCLFLSILKYLLTFFISNLNLCFKGGGGDLANNSVAQSNDPFEHTSKGTPIDLDSDDHENDDNSKVPAANVNNKRTDNLKVKICFLI